MKNKENILVVIAARFGSKGVKNKNIRKLLGKPLIAHTIQQARIWGRAEDIICSTDSHKIAAIARRYGAKTPFLRPKHLSADTTSKVIVIRHALVTSEKIYNKKYDTIVDLDATAPIRKISDLDNCLKLFRKLKPKSLFSVVRSHKNPYFNMVELKTDGFAKLSKEPKKAIVRRQNTPSVYSMNASIYFYNRDFLVSPKTITPFSDRSAIYVMDDVSAYDIDREIDFKFVELLMKEGAHKE